MGENLGVGLPGFDKALTQLVSRLGARIRRTCCIYLYSRELVIFVLKARNITNVRNYCMHTSYYSITS